MLVAGLRQPVTVCLYTGTSSLDDSCKVKVTASDDLDIDTGSPDNTVLLGSVARGGTREWQMNVLQQPQPAGEEDIHARVYM